MMVGSKRSATDAGFVSSSGHVEPTVKVPTSTGQPFQVANSVTETPNMNQIHSNGLSQRRKLDVAADARGGENQVDDEGWSVAESKSSRKKKRRRLREDPTIYPSINFLDTKPARVQLKALQELALYVLADGIAPTWLAVNNAKQINKIVVLMIPGLDRVTLEDPEILESAISLYEQAIPKDLDTNAVSAEDNVPDSPTTPDIKSPPDMSEAVRASASASATNPESLLGRLVEHVIEIKAPGDSKSNRVHSPLQGMLIAPVPPSGSANSKNKHVEKSPQHTRTPISHFIHTSDELREAEYPVHPAAFTNPQDAALEAARREATFQSLSHGWVDTSVVKSTPDPITSPRTNNMSSPPAPHSRRRTHISSHDPLTQGLKPYALDCEMVLTTDDKSSLARISLMDWSGSTVLDSYVKPDLPIKNYFTQYSGITESHLADVTTTLSDIQKRLLSILGPDSILLGHSLESDLNALKLTHPFIVDTSIIYPHPRGLPLRSSLKFLANRYLKREIQKQGANGHDSVEDARAVLDLVKLKCEKGPRWGTLDANGESIFKRISRCTRIDGSNKHRETAIVEYGTPERGFGKEATYKIACVDDEEVLQGIIRATHGDAPMPNDGNEDPKEAKNTPQDGVVKGQPTPTGQSIPAGGVDFVWGRLRELEALRGWNNPPAAQPPASSGSVAASQANSTTATAPETAESPETLRQTASRTLSRLLTLYAALPPRTLLVTYSGTNDMRPVLRLQQLHAQYRKEFKVKKWDELSVKWTDVEEQQLRSAVDVARRGVGLLAMK